MSYIRSISNPEKLYIYESLDGVEIIMGTSHLGVVPTKIFNGLLKKYCKQFHEHPCEYKGAKIDEEWIDGEPKVKFTYENIEFFMWDVTWEYIVLFNIPQCSNCSGSSDNDSIPIEYLKKWGNELINHIIEKYQNESNNQ